MSELSKEIIDNAPEGAEYYAGKDGHYLPSYFKFSNDVWMQFDRGNSLWFAMANQSHVTKRRLVRLPIAGASEIGSGAEVDATGTAELISKVLSEKVGSKHNHYFKDVSDLEEIDVYRVCDVFEVNDHSGAIHHAIKKLLCSGQRGAKDYQKGLEEARDSIQRKLDMMKEDGE